MIAVAHRTRRTLASFVASVLVVSFLTVAGLARDATAQVAGTPCPAYDFEGSWRVEVFDIACADIPAAALRGAIEMTLGRRPASESIDGYGCLVSPTERLTSCRNPAGGGFIVSSSDARLGTPPTAPPSRLPSTDKPPPETAAGLLLTKPCRPVTGATWTLYSSTLPESQRRTWRLRAQTEKCEALVPSARLVSRYLTDPFIGRTFDAGDDRCVRADAYRAICAYGYARTDAWERYGSGRAPVPLDTALVASIEAAGLYEVASSGTPDPAGTRAVPLRLPPAETWQIYPLPPLADVADRCLATTGAPWSYGVGQAVLATGRTWWSMASVSMCTEARRLIPRLTSRLARSEPVNETTMLGWTCLTARRSDLAGATAITCARRRPYLASPDWFSVYEGTPFNSAFGRMLAERKIWGALSYAADNGNLVTAVKACDGIDLPTRPWRRTGSLTGAEQRGTFWFVQTVAIPCGLAKVVSDRVIAAAAGVNIDPSQNRAFGLDCFGRREQAMVVCALFEASPNVSELAPISPDTPPERRRVAFPRIGVGPVNEDVYAGVAAAASGVLRAAEIAEPAT